jgi:hypothetical protein
VCLPERKDGWIEGLGPGSRLGSARRVIVGVDETKVRQKIAFFDWLAAREDSRVEKNPAGFLYRSITEDCPLSSDYLAATTPTAAPTLTLL